eukprot:jgi/Mesen1/7971/ME000422S07128
MEKEVDLELLDPCPDIFALFVHYNDLYFRGKLEACTVEWSSGRMTLDHGPAFRSIMDNINDINDPADSMRPAEGYSISVYHSFHDEVDQYRVHHWTCATCQRTIKRALNRTPGPSDCRARPPDGASCGDPRCLWHEHLRTCGGEFVKTAEPADYKDKRKRGKASAAGVIAATASGAPEVLQVSTSEGPASKKSHGAAVTPLCTAEANGLTGRGLGKRKSCEEEAGAAGSDRGHAEGGAAAGCSMPSTSIKSFFSPVSCGKGNEGGEARAGAAARAGVAKEVKEERSGEQGEDQQVLECARDVKDSKTASSKDPGRPSSLPVVAAVGAHRGKDPLLQSSAQRPPEDASASVRASNSASARACCSDVKLVALDAVGRSQHSLQGLPRADSWGGSEPSDRDVDSDAEFEVWKGERHRQQGARQEGRKARLVRKSKRRLEQEEQDDGDADWLPSSDGGNEGDEDRVKGHTGGEQRRAPSEKKKMAGLGDVAEPTLRLATAAAEKDKEGTAPVGTTALGKGRAKRSGDAGVAQTVGGGKRAQQTHTPVHSGRGDLVSMGFVKVGVQRLYHGRDCESDVDEGDPSSGKHHGGAGGRGRTARRRARQECHRFPGSVYAAGDGKGEAQEVRIEEEEGGDAAAGMSRRLWWSMEVEVGSDGEGTPALVNARSKRRRAERRQEQLKAGGGAGMSLIEDPASSDDNKAPIAPILGTSTRVPHETPKGHVVNEAPARDEASGESSQQLNMRKCPSGEEERSLAGSGAQIYVKSHGKEDPGGSFLGGDDHRTGATANGGHREAEGAAASLAEDGRLASGCFARKLPDAVDSRCRPEERHVAGPGCDGTRRHGKQQEGEESSDRGNAAAAAAAAAIAAMAAEADEVQVVSKKDWVKAGSSGGPPAGAEGRMKASLEGKGAAHALPLPPRSGRGFSASGEDNVWLRLGGLAKGAAEMERGKHALAHHGPTEASARGSPSRKVLHLDWDLVRGQSEGNYELAVEGSSKSYEEAGGQGKLELPAVWGGHSTGRGTSHETGGGSRDGTGSCGGSEAGKSNTGDASQEEEERNPLQVEGAATEDVSRRADGEAAEVALEDEIAPGGEICPICQIALPRGSSNEEVNCHIDLCLAM